MKENFQIDQNGELKTHVTVSSKELREEFSPLITIDNVDIACYRFTYLDSIKKYCHNIEGFYDKLVEINNEFLALDYNTIDNSELIDILLKYEEYFLNLVKSYSEYKSLIELLLIGLVWCYCVEEEGKGLISIEF